MQFAIIGAGTLGLTLAYRLSQAGIKTTVYEAAPQIGGLATWFDYGPFVWDKYYHVILKSDQVLLDLINELGISEKMHWSVTKTGFLWQGKHISMSNYWEFLKFPALNMLQKMQLATGLLKVQRIKDPAELEKIPAHLWLSKVFGKQVYATIWEPLLASKFGVLKDKVPATIMWATIIRYQSTRSTDNGQECLGYLAGNGLKSFFNALETAIIKQQGKILTSCPVQSVTKTTNDKYTVVTEKETAEFDYVISTLPSRLLEKVAPEHPELVMEPQQQPEFIGVIRLAMILKKPLSEFYITNLIDKGFPFTGIIELSQLIAADDLQNHGFVMIPRYDVMNSAWFDKSDEQISDDFLQHMRPIWHDIDDNIIKTHVHKEKIVQALWINAPPKAEPRHSADKRIWSINAELAGRDTMNNNAIVKVANTAATNLIGLIK